MKDIRDVEPHDEEDCRPARAFEIDGLYGTIGVDGVEDETRRDFRCTKVVRKGYRIGVVCDSNGIRRKDLESHTVRVNITRKPPSVEILYARDVVIASVRWRGAREVKQQRGVGLVLGREGGPVTGNDGANVGKISIRKGLGEVSRGGGGDR